MNNPKYKVFFDKAFELEKMPTMAEIYRLTIASGNKKAFEWLVKDGNKDKQKAVSVTYSEFDSLVKKTASSLDSKLPKETKGGFVGLKMDNSLDWVAVFWGLLMAGRKPLLISTAATSLEVTAMLKNAYGSKNNVDNAVVIVDKPLEGVSTLFAKEVVGAGMADFKAEFSDEVAFCTSGTTGEQKVCSYYGKNLSHQIMAAFSIPEQSEELMYTELDGDLKILAFLPFYHIFGFVAVLLWYLFFGKTVVFLENLAPPTILGTCRDLKVTHIYSVPLFWNGVYSAAVKRSQELTGFKGKLLKKVIGHATDFNRGYAVAAEPAASGFLLRQLRKKLLGDKVRFMISGGGFISPKVLSVVNAFGYPLHNGFGMTEVGITSVNMAGNVADRIDGNIGTPLYGIEYKLDKGTSGSQDGTLLIKSNQICNGFYRDGVLTPHQSEWYNSGDLAKIDKNGKYHIVGRNDDMVKSSSGEKIVPDEIEQNFLPLTSIVAKSCIVSEGDSITLVCEVEEGKITDELKSKLKEEFIKINHGLPFYKQVTTVFVTDKPFPLALGYKVKRGAIKKLLGTAPQDFIAVCGREAATNIGASDKYKEFLPGVKAIFADVLKLNADTLGSDDDFITTLGGDSMTYVSIVMNLEQKFKTPIDPNLYGKLRTPADFAGYIANSK